MEVRNQSSALLAEYRYNGLNQRITWHYDATGNGTTDGSDPTYHFAYDEKWRIAGTWRGTDTDPKEVFTYHNAGVAGRGGSSYIDSVILRDRDNNGGGGWTGAADGVLEARHYYAQNWRADVSGVFDNSGAVLEWQKYSAYGIPYLLTPGDYDKNGVVEKADDTAFYADYGVGNLRADMDEDGDVDAADQALFVASHNKATPGGRWKLSASDIGNRKGYAGYEHEGFGNDLAAPEIAHVRNRVLHFGLGRWTRRDPAGYVDGPNLQQLNRTMGISACDPNGLWTVQILPAYHNFDGVPTGSPPSIGNFRHAAAWYFEVQPALNCPGQGGWIVQQVTSSVQRATDCTTPFIPHAPVTNQFWEAWRIEHGQTRPLRPFNGIGVTRPQGHNLFWVPDYTVHTDESGVNWTLGTPSRVLESHRGVVAAFCDSDVGSDDPWFWPSGGGPAGILPWTKTPPPWWRYSESDCHTNGLAACRVRTMVARRGCTGLFNNMIIGSANSAPAGRDIIYLQ